MTVTEALREHALREAGVIDDPMGDYERLLWRWTIIRSAAFSWRLYRESVWWRFVTL